MPPVNLRDVGQAVASECPVGRNQQLAGQVLAMFLADREPVKVATQTERLTRVTAVEKDPGFVDPALHDRVVGEDRSDALPVGGQLLVRPGVDRFGPADLGAGSVKGVDPARPEHPGSMYVAIEVLAALFYPVGGLESHQGLAGQLEVELCLPIVVEVKRRPFDLFTHRFERGPLG